METPLGIRLDPAHLSVGADAVETRACDMRARRDQVGAAVEGVLAGWRGDAATRFSALWEEWRDGADDVIAALSSSALSLRHARDLMEAVDVDRSGAHARLRARLAIQGDPG